MRVRDAVLVAAEPDQLLFEELPAALDLPPVAKWASESAAVFANEFAERLRRRTDAP